MDPLKLKQGSDDWLQYRLARVTGSRIKDVLAFGAKGQELANRRAYMVELLAESLTGLIAEHYVSPEMKWGSETESLAVAEYERRTGNECDIVGICQHPAIARSCASPDRFVGAEGVLEAKCPKTSTHIAWMMAGVLPPEHLPQCHWELACSGRLWLDFISFDPRLPLRHQLFVVRLWRDEKAIAEIADGVQQFLLEMDGMIASLNTRNPPIAEPDFTLKHPEELLSGAEIDEFFDNAPAYEEPNA